MTTPFNYNVGVVITAGAGREANLRLTVAHVIMMGALIEELVVVFDGPDAYSDITDLVPDLHLTTVTLPEKHRPGMEQPRNVGVEYLEDSTHVWFIDSDMVFDPVIGVFAIAAVEDHPKAIVIGPYDWMAPGETQANGRIEQHDGRWPSFNAPDAGDEVAGDLGRALACFGGNLIWPIDEFKRVGGFHPELHHGRCEDGELGLRACESLVPMILVPEMKMYHIWHPRSLQWALETNKRDVPLLNAWHPWVEDRGLEMVPEDGTRFNWRCPTCGESINTWFYWLHKQEHHGDK